MSLPVDFFISQPGKTINLKNEKDLKLTTSYGENGDHECSFQWCNWEDSLFEFDARVSLRDPVYGYFWSGYWAAPRLGGFYGKPSQITARGWKHTIQDRGWLERKVWAAGTPMSTIVQEAQTKMSHIGAGVSLPGGLSQQISEDSNDFILQTPDNVFNYIKDLWAYQATPLLWEIKQNQAHRFSEDAALHMRFTDFAPRYFVHLTDKDEFQPAFDSDVIFNHGAITYGNGLVETEEAVQPFLYSIIKRIREKRVNANNDISGTLDAQALTQKLVTRNNTLRPVNTSMTIHCDTPIRAIPPASPFQSVNMPHYLIRNYFVIRVLNDISKFGPYAITDYFIVDAKYDWDSQSLSLTVGDPVMYEAFELLQSYMVSRTSIGLDSGVINEPLRDADQISVFGPSGDGATPATSSEGIPIFLLDKTLTNPDDITKPYLPYNGAVHPHDIADYGVQLNFGREADSIGGKGFIRVIPCRLLDWTLDFTPPPGSDTVPTDSITIQLYTTYPYTVGTNIIATISVSSAQSASGTITASPASLAIFQQGGKVGVRVSSAAATSGAGFQIGLGGKKIFPDLGITT